jgi:hypothetical protein
MNIIRVIILLFIFSIIASASSLDTKIKELKSALPEQRYKIMNSIKIELLKLNEAQRAKYMQKLLKGKTTHHRLRKRLKNIECINQHIKHKHGKQKNSHSKIKEHIKPPKQNPQHNNDKDRNNHNKNGKKR